MRVPTSVTTSIEVPVLTNSKPGVRSFVRTSFYSSTSTSSSTSSSSQSTIFSNFFLPNSSKLIHDYSPQFHFVPLTIPVTFSKTKFDNLTELGLFAYCQRIRNTTIKVTSFRVSISNRENSRILEIIIIGSRSFSYTSEDTLTTNRFILLFSTMSSRRKHTGKIPRKVLSTMILRGNIFRNNLRFQNVRVMCSVFFMPSFHPLSSRNDRAFLGKY